MALAKTDTATVLSLRGSTAAIVVGFYSWCLSSTIAKNYSTC